MCHRLLIICFVSSPLLSLPALVSCPLITYSSSVLTHLLCPLLSLPAIVSCPLLSSSVLVFFFSFSDLPFLLSSITSHASSLLLPSTPPLLPISFALLPLSFPLLSSAFLCFPLLSSSSPSFLLPLYPPSPVKLTFLQ